MPVVGFIDTRGKRVRFADIAKGAGAWELPRPFLRALASGYRAADHYGSTDVVSVTTLGNPVRQTRLLQRHEVFVDPLRSMWAMFGTIGHSILERAALEEDDGLIAERRLVIDFEGQLVGGTFDLLERDGDIWIGRDYKVTGAYGVSKMKHEGVVEAKLEYAMQANVYRYMIARHDAMEVVDRGLVPFQHAGLVVSKWQLVAWSRDWSASKHSGSIKPVELVDVPLISAERVENYLRQRIVEYKAAGMCDDDGLPKCSPDEMWHGRRCAQWCDAAEVCSQFNERKRTT